MNKFELKLIRSLCNKKEWVRVKHTDLVDKTLANGSWLLVNRKRGIVLKDFACAGYEFRVEYPVRRYIGFITQKFARRLNKKLIKKNEMAISNFLCDYMNNPNIFFLFEKNIIEKYNIKKWFAEVELESFYYMYYNEDIVKIWFTNENDASLFKLIWFNSEEWSDR